MSSRAGLSVLLALPFLLAGCTAPPPTDSGAPKAVALDASQVQAPKGASVEGAPHGLRILLQGPLESKDPFRFTIPAGVTRVDARLELGNPQAPASVSLVNAATGRPRCQPDFTAAWFTPTKGESRCSGLTQLDPLPAVWRTGFRVLGSGDRLELLLSTEPLDGQAAAIRVENLAMPRFKERATESVAIPSAADGSKLFAEVTRPDTTDPVPTILVSSPYNAATRLAGMRAQNSTIADWVPRGYAVVSADVRGFAESEGCVDVWGFKEQQDQYDLVEWVAQQPWSNGKVGFYGQSYVGTTPVEAASLVAPHLTTIITVAPVINAYEDWHFGGVPNGENTGSPGSYQSLGADPVDPMTADPLQEAMRFANGYCNERLLIKSKLDDPRAVYDGFFRERDFKTMASNVQASVFYTQGFYDTNVKSQMIPGWFDKLRVPKKALFGDWVHQHPPRADQELLFHAWFDHWLLGLDTGIMETPTVEVRTNVDTVRAAHEWPPQDATELRLGLDLDAGKITNEPQGRGTASYLAQPQPDSAPLPAEAVVPSVLRLSGEPFAERLYLAGQMQLTIRASFDGIENTYFYAGLWDVDERGERQLVSFGMLNAAHRNGHEAYEPVPAGQALDYDLSFLVTEYVIEANHHLELELRSADVNDWSGAVTAAYPSEPGLVTLDGTRSALILSTLTQPGDEPLPASVGPSPSIP